MAEKEVTVSNKLFLVAKVDHEGQVREARVCEAADMIQAVEFSSRRESILALNCGVVNAVWELPQYPPHFHTQYDGEPFNENHTPTKAKLVTRAKGNHKVGTLRSGRFSFLGGPRRTRSEPRASD